MSDFSANKKTLYVISGCNGAGKTTASYTILPELLNCNEFVNADEIAKGLSPFNPESTSIQAGRLMLNRLEQLVNNETNFAFETTLSTRSFKNLLHKAHLKGFAIYLIFFWLDSEELAIKRVETRVREGGHNIPAPVIRRRYNNGLKNFFSLYKPIVDNWMFINNSGNAYEIIAEGYNKNETILNKNTWDKLKEKYDDNE